MKKIILTLTIAMLTVTTVNAESWRNKNNRDNGRNNTTIVTNNERRGNDMKVVNRDSRPNNRGFKIDNSHHESPMVGQQVNDLPRGAVKVHRHGRDYYRVGNVLYNKIATATGIIYSIVELLNS